MYIMCSVLYYRIVTTVERHRKYYHEFIAGSVYLYESQVNNTGGNEQVVFPKFLCSTVVTAFGYGNVDYDC